jgi:hypothetical protein
VLRRTLGRVARFLTTETRAEIQGVQDRIGDLRREIEAIRLLQGAHAAISVAAMDKLPYLAAASFRVTSQGGEDGIIEWLVSKLPMLKPSFVEFGVESYREANTLFLLQRHNWRGLIADIGSSHLERLRSSDLMWRHDLTAIQMPVRRDNVNSLFVDNGFDGEIGILSIDIDGNDYWIWDAIEATNPGLVICEYNAIFGDVHAISVPADDHFDRTEKHWSNQYWGASIEAMCHLGATKGYTFLGTNNEGCNAFLVRNDLAPFVVDRVADKRPRPSLFRDSRDETGTLTYLSGKGRLAAIEQLPVIDVRSGKATTLDLVSPSLYSEHWREIMGLQVQARQAKASGVQHAGKSQPLQVDAR